MGVHRSDTTLNRHGMSWGAWQYLTESRAGNGVNISVFLQNVQDQVKFLQHNDGPFEVLASPALAVGVAPQAAGIPG